MFTDNCPLVTDYAPQRRPGVFTGASQNFRISASAAIIHGIVERALPIIFSKPKLTIDLHPDVLETAMNRIEGQLRAQGFEGELQFRSNYDLGTSEIRLDWAADKSTAPPPNFGRKSRR